jgi:hypothetical protein
MLAILVPASVTVVGYWFKQQDDRRLVQEQNDSEKERFQAREKEREGEGPAATGRGDESRRFVRTDWVRRA